MKWQKFVVLCGLFAVLSFLFIRQNQKQEVFEASSLASGKYCLAIRGNGELEPAHWGAAARVIEQWGLPSAMSGGSSGSITMFLLNAVAQNPFVNDQSIDALEKNRRAALLVKSFTGFYTELKQTKSAQDFFKLYGDFNLARAKEMAASMVAAFAAKNYTEITRLLTKGAKEGFFDLVSTEPLLKALQNREEKKSQFYLQQLQESVELFGKFDATKDANLFFRPGIVSFPNAAVSFGRWASFYALPTQDQEILKSGESFVRECSGVSEEKTWSELIKAKPACGDLFHAVFVSYFQHEPKEHFEERQIGSPIAVYPATSVLIGNAVKEVGQAFADYNEKLDPQFGKDFHIQNPEEVVFGYWGDPKKLAGIHAVLDPADEKNRRFYPLGQTTWKQVLSLSPAEPGLSALNPFEAEGKKVVSAGGWSDLHPINILKASGCEHVVFLTRQGGESLFAQGVANRLMSLKRDPAKLVADLNETGDTTADANDLWSKLFNMANPKSSLYNALHQASAVACTNWNAFDVTKNLLELVDESYHSSYWIPEEKKAQVNLSPILQEHKTGCQPLD